MSRKCDPQLELEAHSCEIWVTFPKTWKITISCASILDRLMGEEQRKRTHYGVNPGIAQHERLLRLELQILPKETAHSAGFWFTGHKKS
jgi:hypothetical protein